MQVPDPACFGQLCHDARGLTLLHLAPEHVLLGAALLVASFSVFYTLAWAWLHRFKRLAARVAVCVGLSSAYMLLVLRGIPWHPYWIRELHVMTCCMYAWKTLELALLRREEVLPPLATFLLHDALVLRPEVLQDPSVRRAKELAAKAPLLQRICNALPKLGWAFVQYVGVELINAYLMQQPIDYHSLPVWRRFWLGALFAECLYLHLAYFFSCMCAVNVVLFADAVEAWPEPFNRPFAATSPIDFWNRRWHGMFKWYFVALVYRPVQSLIHSTGKPSPLLKTLPTLAVFFTSGLFHELLLWVNFGKASGEQLAFFMLHALMLVLQRYLERAAQGDKPTRPAGSKASLNPNENSYGSLATCVPGGGAAGQQEGSRVVHISAKTGNVADSVQGEETEGSGDDGSCSGPEGQVAAPAVGASCVVQRSNARASKASSANGGKDSAAASSARAVPVRPAPAAARRRGWEQRLLVLLMGRPDESLVMQYVRYWVQLLVFNTFLGLTLILFFSPWFRYGYHQELRVFVPGPVHELVLRFLSEWSIL